MKVANKTTVHTILLFNGLLTSAVTIKENILIIKDTFILS